MIVPRTPFVVFVLIVVPGIGVAESVQVTPQSVALSGNFANSQLLVTKSGSASDEVAADFTHSATYESTDPAVVTVSSTGRVRAVANGTAEIRVTVDDDVVMTSVTVDGVSDVPRVDFTRDVSPILSKAGCNMGACHASQYGKGGFKLSVFGFEPAKDHDAIVRDSQQRRVTILAPNESLLLRKPTMQVPHGGGRRLQAGSVDYRILSAWIAGGAPAPIAEPATVERIVVTPARRVMPSDVSTMSQRPESGRQQLRVEAVYSDGTTRDVTQWAKYDSMDDAVLDVTRDGLVTVQGRGQAPVMVRFEGHAEIAMFVVPYSKSVELAGWTNHNFVDELASAKFRELGIEPSGLCDDAAFLRRAFLDATGSVPTVDETTAFLTSNDPAKREQLVDRLLGLTGDPSLDLYNDRYAAWWTLKWSDLIRNNSNDVGEQGMWALHNWIRESFRTNRPFDQFVSELVTARGSIYISGPANYFRINRDSSTLAESTAQLFLGVRLQCAKCHHHPFEKYSQGDYYGFAAFFSRVSTKNSQEFGLFGRESVVMVRSSGEVRHPKTGRNLPPTPLGGESVEHPLDRRIPLAEWLTSRDNQYFARSVVNRYMSYLLGRGLVEPVDDLRATNPASNVALMDALAGHFADNGFDLKRLIRAIMVSRLYQLDSQPTAANHSDRRFYSYYKVKRIPAEALLDAVDQVTGVPTKFKSLPQGTRAIELPDAEYPNYFLTTFAKPKRASVCECERMPDENLAQALHTLNGDILAGKIAHKDGRIAKLIAEETGFAQMVEQLYLSALNRYPTDAERAAAAEFRSEYENEQEFHEDLLWSLMNSKQFLFVR